MIIITLGAPLNIQDMSPGMHLLARLQETVRQYNKGDTVIVSGARTQKLAVSEAQAMKYWLTKHEIPCIMEERAINTIENGVYSRQMVDELELEGAIMVITSDFHLPRASLIFLHYFVGKEIYFRPVQTPNPDHLNEREPMHLLRLIQEFPPPDYECLSLIEEVKRGHVNGVKANIEQVRECDETGNTALHWAASYGFTQICEYLLTNGAVVNAPNRRGMLPIHYALINESIETVWVLLQSGTDLSLSAVNTRWKGKCTPEQALFQMRKRIEPEVYTPLVLMLNKFVKGPSVVWIRHAESILNRAFAKNENTTGIFDATLTREGGRVLEDINFWVRKYDLLNEYDVFVSPLERTLETCFIITAGTKVKPVADHRICERLNHTGSVGKPRNLLESSYKWDFSRVPSHWWFSPEVNNIQNLTVFEESWETFNERIKLFLTDLRKDMKNKTLIVTHGGVIHQLYNSELKARNCDAFSLCSPILI